MLVTSIFSISHNVFYPSLSNFQFLSHIYFVICKCFQFGHVQNFVVGEELQALGNKVKAKNLSKDSLQIIESNLVSKYKMTTIVHVYQILCWLHDLMILMSTHNIGFGSALIDLECCQSPMS